MEDIKGLKGSEKDLANSEKLSLRTARAANEQKNLLRHDHLFLQDQTAKIPLIGKPQQ